MYLVCRSPWTVNMNFWRSWEANFSIRLEQRWPRRRVYPAYDTGTKYLSLIGNDPTPMVSSSSGPSRVAEQIWLDLNFSVPYRNRMIERRCFSCRHLQKRRLVERYCQMLKNDSQTLIGDRFFSCSRLHHALRWICHSRWSRFLRRACTRCALASPRSWMPAPVLPSEQRGAGGR